VGIVAYINNHSFLDNPTFRGMRWNLLKSFDKIYIIDLHGNVKKKETAPDGSKDENVFDIQQGVSINIFIKKEQEEIASLAKIFHIDLHGLRDYKYEFLRDNRLSLLKWTKLALVGPQYFFAKKNFVNKNEYDYGFSIQNLFPLNGIGITTAHDDFVISESKTHH
jgi:predicted helicase